MNITAYPKGPWNVRIKVPIETFLDAWLTVVTSNGNYGDVAKVIGCEIVDVQFAEARLIKSGVKLPKLNFTENNDDRVVMMI